MTTQFKLLEDIINQRILVYDDASLSIGKMLAQLKKLEGNRLPWLGKMIVFCREPRWKDFIAGGFRLEGWLRHYYRGEAAAIVSKFYKAERLVTKDFLQAEGVLEKIFVKPVRKSPQELSGEYKLRKPVLEDLPELVNLYKEVFEIYPTPIHESRYLMKALQGKDVFQVVEHRGQVVSSASACVDSEKGVAEMTDCATLPGYRGQGLMHHLIIGLEKELATRGIYSVYSLARAKSMGVNLVLSRNGYSYRGRLLNNCRICSGYEDMNLWEKNLLD